MQSFGGMDLLGDLGATEQLTSARAENAVLKKKVEELSSQVKLLTVENESLKAEVEMYRKEAALPNFSNLALGQSESAMEEEQPLCDDFVQSGNGVYSKVNEISLPGLHGQSNPLCCVLSPDGVMLASGGANGTVALCPWGTFYSANSTPDSVVAGAVQLETQAPVIAVAFSPRLRGVLCVGCMDGSIWLAQYQTQVGGRVEAKLSALPKTQHHQKYVRNVAWSPNSPLLATSSADGTVKIFRANLSVMQTDVEVEPVTSLHLPGAVEAMEFSQTHLICYTRGTPYLSYFDVNDDFKQTKINLNAGETGTANHSDHVSYTIMDLAVFEDKYLAAATDSSRNIVMDLATGRQIRNLYGHENDGYSQPKIAWSSNGSYLYGNHQHESTLCVWDIASSQLVDKIPGHSQPIRCIYSSSGDDLVLTTGFDKTVNFWFPPQKDHS